MEQIPEHLLKFIPISQDVFRHCPPEAQQFFITQAQTAYNAQQQPILEARSIFEELVPEEFFDDNYVYEEYDPIVEDDLFEEFVQTPRARSNGSFRGHPNNLRALVSRQLALGNQVKFTGNMTVRMTVTKPYKALFYNQFTLLRITFNELETDEDDVLFEGTFEISPQEPSSHQTGPHKRSRIGQGKTLYDLKEYEDDLVYIPASGFCFARCVEYLYGQEFHVKYFDFAAKEGIIEDKFPQCKITRFNEFTGTKIGFYDEKNKKILYCKNYEHVIAICDGHYIVLKGSKGTRNFLKGYKIATDKIVWEEKEITNEMLSNVEETKKPRTSDFNMFENTSIWDAETTTDETTCEAKPYGAAFISMAELVSVVPILDRISSASPEEINQVKKLCNKTRVFGDIQHMINTIVSKYRNKPPSERNAKGRLKNKEIYFYAHNASKFDNYLIMILKYISFKDLLITGRGLVRLSTRHFLRQEDRVVEKGKRKGEIFTDKQYLIIHWCCTKSFMLGSLKSLCTSYKIPPALAKSSMDHTAITAVTVSQLRHIWVPYLRLDVLSLAICFYLYSKSIYDNMCTKIDEHGTYHGISLNSCVSNSSLAWKGFLNSYLADEKAEPIFTWQDENIEKFIRKTVYGGRVAALNNKFAIAEWKKLEQYLFKAFKANNMNELTNRLQKIQTEIRGEWDKGAYMEMSFDKYYSAEFQRLYPAETKFMREFIKNKELLYACDAKSLYPSVEVLEDQWPRIDSARLMTPEEKQSVIDRLNSSTFYPQIGFFHVTMYTPTNNFLTACASRTEHGNVLTVGKKTECYVSIDIEEEVKHNGSKVLDIHFGIICDENYKTPIFRPFVQNQSEQRDKAKSSGNEVSQLSTKQTMCSLYGKKVQQPIFESWCIESKARFEKNFDHKYLDVVNLNNGSYACKKTQENVFFMPSYLGSVQLAGSRKIMNKIIAVVNGFKGLIVYYMDTDSLYILARDYAKLKEAGYIGNNMGQAKNDYGEGGIVFGLFIANKVKFCMTITEEGVPDFHKTFKGHDNLTGLSYDDYERMVNGEPLEEVISRWKRSLDKGVQIKENNMAKKFDPFVNFVRRQRPDENGWMFPIGYTFSPEGDPEEM